MPTETQLETKRRKQLNKYLGEICRKNHGSLSEPLKQINKAVEMTGFDTEPLEGIYCGAKGETKNQIGNRTWMVIQWYKLSDYPNERWEVNAYAS
jgi:hypothetical protein